MKISYTDTLNFKWIKTGSTSGYYLLMVEGESHFRRVEADMILGLGGYYDFSITTYKNNKRQGAVKRGRFKARNITEAKRTLEVEVISRLEDKWPGIGVTR